MPSRLPELIGRLMVDPDFLAEVQRTPDAVLASYELTDEERGAVRHALERLVDAPAGHRAQALRTVLLKRVST